MGPSADPVLERLERDAIICCTAMAVVALAVPGGGIGAALAVLAGGFLIGLSYWLIKSGIVGLVRVAEGLAARRRADPDVPARAPAVARPVLKFVGRYALLTGIAYVMIARLRLHPIGLLAGASSIVAAAGLEALRIAVGSASKPR